MNDFDHGRSYRFYLGSLSEYFWEYFSDIRIVIGINFQCF